MILSKKRITEALISLGDADVQAGLRLCSLKTPEDRFSCVEAHLIGVHACFKLDNTLALSTKILCSGPYCENI